MIHKRFNHTRHLIWATFLLTIFIGSAVTHKANNAGAFIIENTLQQKPATETPALVALGMAQ